MATLGDNDRMLLGGCTPDISPATALDVGLPYEDAIKRAVRECKLLKDYEHARLVWTIVSDMVQRLGAPYELVRKYQEELIAYFENRNNQPSADLMELLTHAATLGSYFWGKSSWAVIYRACRDKLGYGNLTVSDFEKYVMRLSKKQTIPFPVKKGSVQKAIENNSFLTKHVDEWEKEGVKERAIKLRDQFLQAVV